MEKKPLTTKQKQYRYRSLQYAAVGGEFASIITPFIIIGAVNFDEWFIDNPEGYKVGIGATLALAVMGIAVALITMKKEKESKLTEGWITLLVFWFAIAFIFKLMSSIYAEIFSLMMWCGLGLAAAFGLDIVSKNLKAKADAYKEARADANKETIKEQAKREVEEEIPVD